MNPCELSHCLLGDPTNLEVPNFLTHVMSEAQVWLHQLEIQTDVPCRLGLGRLKSAADQQSLNFFNVQAVSANMYVYHILLKFAEQVLSCKCF